MVYVCRDFFSVYSQCYISFGKSYMKAAIHILQDYTHHVPFIKNISQEKVSINRIILANVWHGEM